MDGIRNDIKSKYWDYIDYYNDGEVWADTVLFEAFGGKNLQGNVFYIYKEIFEKEEQGSMIITVCR